MTQTIPSRAPNDDKSLTGAIRFAFKKLSSSTDDMLPAVVISYDLSKNTVVVRPLIKKVTASGENVQRETIEGIPVMRMGAGNVSIIFKPKSGDIGWIKANDRDISLFKSSGVESIPNTKRIHSFSDCIFIPDKTHGVTVPSEHSEDLTIQNDDGSSCIAVMKDNVIMQMDSTTKAVIFPRMTQTQRDLIPDPQDGMTIWNTDTHALNSYNGATESWPA